MAFKSLGNVPGELRGAREAPAETAELGIMASAGPLRLPAELQVVELRPASPITRPRPRRRR